MQSLPADSVDAALFRVLNRPEFAERETPALLQLISDLSTAFRRWIGSLLLGWLPDQWHPAFAWLLVVLLVALALWALVALVRALVGGPRAVAVAKRERAQPDARAESAEGWEAVARAAAAEGRFRDASIALYLAAVLRLEERGVLRYHPGKTPGDYRSEVRSHPDARRPFDAFVRAFLPVAFGSRTPDASAFDALVVSATQLGVNG